MLTQVSCIFICIVSWRLIRASQFHADAPAWFGPAINHAVQLAVTQAVHHTVNHAVNHAMGSALRLVQRRLDRMDRRQKSMRKSLKKDIREMKEDIREVKRDSREVKARLTSLEIHAVKTDSTCGKVCTPAFDLTLSVIILRLRLLQIYNEQYG